MQKEKRGQDNHPINPIKSPINKHRRQPNRHRIVAARLVPAIALDGLADLIRHPLILAAALADIKLMPLRPAPAAALVALDDPARHDVLVLGPAFGAQLLDQVGDRHVDGDLEHFKLERAAGVLPRLQVRGYQVDRRRVLGEDVADARGEGELEAVGARECCARRVCVGAPGYVVVVDWWWWWWWWRAARGELVGGVGGVPYNDVMLDM